MTFVRKEICFAMARDAKKLSIENIQSNRKASSATPDSARPLETPSTTERSGLSAAAEVPGMPGVSNFLRAFHTDFSLASIGYGLWWTVLFSNGLNGPSWLPLLQNDSVLSQNVRITLYVVYAAMFVVALAARKRLAPLNAHRRLLFAGSLASSVGMVLMDLACFGLLDRAFVYLGVGVFSVGTMVPILGFGEMFCVLGARRACVNVCISLAVSVPLFFCVAWLGSVAFPVAIVLEVACPLLSLPLLFKAWSSCPKRPNHEEIERGPVKMPPGFLFAMCMYGAAFGLVLGLGVGSEDPGFMRLVANAVFVGVFSLGILAAVVTSKSFSIGKVYRPILPLIAIGFILLAVLGSSGTVISMGIVLAGYACARIFSMTVYADITVRVPAPAFATAALGAAADAGGVAVGSAFAQLLIAGMGLEGQHVYDLSLVIVGVLIIVTVFLLSESKLESLWGVLPEGQAASDAVRAEEADGCQRAAERHGLTPRETEVLEYLVRGKSAADIADELTISKSTVLTHTKRIYAKFDVHSRVELMNAVRTDGTAEEKEDSPFSAV